MKLKLIKTEPCGLATKFFYELDGKKGMIALSGHSNDTFFSYMEHYLWCESLLGTTRDINPHSFKDCKKC